MDTNEQTANAIEQAVEQALHGDALDVQSYTVNGRTVQGRSLAELIELHKYATKLRQRANGIRRTRVSFQ